jgi:TolB-like protein
LRDLNELFTELRQRKIIQVLIAYAIVAWGAAQVVEFAVENYALSRKLLDVTLLLLGLGLPAAMVISWYHGEKGHQRATRMEAVILIALLVLAGIGTYRISRAEPAFDLPADEVVIDLGSESVAVLPFENRLREPDTEWLGSGLAELITTGLAQIPTLQVVSGQRLFDLLRLEGRHDTGRIPDELATRIAYRAGARYMVDGSILGRAEDMTVNANLVDVASGRVVAAAKARGSDVFVLVDSISADLSAQILGAAVEPTEVASVADITTQNVDAYRAYQAGLQAQRRWHVGEAFRHYQRAVELDPGFAIAHLRLAGLAFTNGDISTALTALRAAQANRDRASGRDRLYLDGMLASILEGDRDAAIESLTELVRRYPDEKEGRLALWQFYDEQSEERRALIEEAIALDPLFASGYNELAY